VARALMGGEMGTDEYEGEREIERMPTAADNGMVNLPSDRSVDEIVDVLTRALQAHAIKLFAIVDHDGEADNVGITMRPTKLLIFGNPRAGSPVMVAAPSSAIDLPLKILVWQDAAGQVWVSYNSPHHLQERHGIPAALVPNLAAVKLLAASAAG
jgi:uncharacterized protein (DUF302 family)